VTGCEGPGHKPSNGALGTFVRLLRPTWYLALASPLFMLLEVSTTLRQPRMVRHIIDVAIARRDLGVVLHTGAKMLALTMVGMVGGLGCLFTTVLVVQRFGRDLREHLFRKVQSLSYGNLDRLHTGSLITRLTNDVNQVQEALTMFLRHGVRILTTLFGSMIMAAYTSPRLAVIFLFLIPVVFTVLTVLTKRAYPMYSRVQQRLDALNMVLQDTLPEENASRPKLLDPPPSMARSARRARLV